MRDVTGGTNESDDEVVERAGGSAGEFKFKIGGARDDVGQVANTAAQSRAVAGAPLPEQVVAAEGEGRELVGAAGRERRCGAEGAQGPDGAVEPGDIVGGIFRLPPLVDDAPRTKLPRLGAGVVAAVVVKRPKRDADQVGKTGERGPTFVEPGDAGGG